MPHDPDPVVSEAVDAGGLPSGPTSLLSAPVRSGSRPHTPCPAPPRLSVLVIDRKTRVGAHQSSHNNVALHAGLYYAPDSLKVRLSRTGKVAMEVFAAVHGIPVERSGKVVAVDEAEVPRFEALKQRALANGVQGLEELDIGRLTEFKPHVLGLRALYSPTTGIIDFMRRD